MLSSYLIFLLLIDYKHTLILRDYNYTGLKIPHTYIEKKQTPKIK